VFVEIKHFFVENDKMLEKIYLKWAYLQSEYRQMLCLVKSIQLTENNVYLFSFSGAECCFFICNFSSICRSLAAVSTGLAPPNIALLPDTCPASSSGLERGCSFNRGRSFGALDGGGLLREESRSCEESTVDIAVTWRLGEIN